MKKKILASVLTVTFLTVGFCSALVFDGIRASVIKEIKVLQDIGVAQDEFVGSSCLAEANLYEQDFNSKYLFPMQGMCVNNEDKLAVLDTSYGRVHVMDQALVNSFTFGSLAELIYPVDIDYANQNYYVADALGGFIKVYTKDGIPVKTLSNGLIGSPVGVAVIGNSVFVSDYFSNSIYKLDSNGSVLRSYNISFPGGLSTNHKDTVIALSMSERKCYIFDNSLNIVQSFSVSSLIFPCDTAIDSSLNIYFVDRGLKPGSLSNGRIAVYSKSGNFLKFIGTPTTQYPNQPDATFLTPSGIAIDSSNKIYVFDSGYYYWNSNSEAPFGFPLGARISMFNFQGYFVGKKDFLHKNTKGVLVNPISATLDEKGDIWVVNYGGFDTSTLVQFSGSGSFLQEVVKAGSSAIGEAYCLFADKAGNILVGQRNKISQFSSSGTFKKSVSNPSFGVIRKIIKGTDGRLYAVSSSNNRILVLDLELNIIASHGVAESPSGIAQDSLGNFYISSLSDNKVHVYDKTFRELYVIGKGGGRGKEQFYIPEDVAIDAKGNLIVLDTENGRISVWSKEGSLIYLSERKFYQLASIQVEGKYLLVSDCFHNVVRVLSEEFEDVEYAFYVSMQQMEVTLLPLDSDSLTVNVQNLGTKKDAYVVTIESTLPPGSVVPLETMPLTFTLEPGATRKVIITVKAPENVENGKKFELIVKIKSQATGLQQSVNALIRISTEVRPVVFAENAFVQEGQSADIPIYIRTGKTLRGVSFNIVFDSKKLQLISVNAPSPDKSIVLYNATSSGASVAVAYVGEELLYGKALIANARFSTTSFSTNYLSIEAVSTIDVLDDISSIDGKSFLITVGPRLSVNVKDGVTANTQDFTFSGITNPQAKVFVNGREVSVTSAGSFTASVVLTSQSNLIRVVARAPTGEETVIEKTVLFKGKAKIKIVLTVGSPIMEVNGVDLEIDPGRGTSPIIIPSWNRTLVPIRAIVESLGGKVDWSQFDKLVSVTLGGTVIKLWIDNPIAEVNGKKVQIDPGNQYVKPVIINSRTFVPVRFVAESLGCTVEWEPSTRKITIIYESTD